MVSQESNSPKRMKLDEDAINLRQKVELERVAEKERKEEAKRAEKARKEAERQAEKERREAERQAEKERKELERQAEKERKEAERQAEKERKEAERQAEKERKEREKEQEKQRKLAEKQAEKEKKEAEKEAEANKKLRAQPKINLFFKKTDNTESENMSSQNSQPDLASSPAPESAPVTDYRKTILPFQPKLDGQLFSMTCNSTAKSDKDQDPLEFLKSLPTSTPKPKLSNAEFTKQMTLTRESSQVSQLIAQLRIRRLQFSHLSTRYAEDPFHSNVNSEFRPPYIGTSRDLDEKICKELAIDPFRTDLDPQQSYEYDSEAEWDPEEGEDLNEEDEIESDEEMDAEEELKEFYTSDEEDSNSKRPKFVGPLTPVVIWGPNSDLDMFKIISNGPIDPYKVNVIETSNSNQADETQSSNVGENIGSLLQSFASKLDPEQFKTALKSHVDSTSTKTLIVELLKQQFPNATKEIKQLFDLCMERIGKKRNEKRWVLTEKAKNELYGEPSSATSEVKSEDTDSTEQNTPQNPAALFFTPSTRSKADTPSKTPTKDEPTNKPPASDQPTNTLTGDNSPASENPAPLNSALQNPSSQNPSHNPAQDPSQDPSHNQPPQNTMTQGPSGFAPQGSLFPNGAPFLNPYGYPGGSPFGNGFVNPQGPPFDATGAYQYASVPQFPFGNPNCARNIPHGGPNMFFNGFGSQQQPPANSIVSSPSAQPPNDTK